jgi:hypothetical protein
MFLCYIDESGSADLGKGTSHFVLLGFCIQAAYWRGQDAQIATTKRRYGLEAHEIHTGWMTRRYLEQERIPNFGDLDWPTRRHEVEKARTASLLRAAAIKGKAALEELKKNFRKTRPYVHLTRDERFSLLRELANIIGTWGACRLFAEAIDKRAFRIQAPATPPLEEAFQQVVTRFHRFLETRQPDAIGLIIQDNNPTAARRLTDLMRVFHQRGTMFTQIPHIVETPFFVDSRLTSTVQLADLCAYATRRFFENGEIDLFDRIYPRFDGSGVRLVGIRHYTGQTTCACRVCTDRGR